MSKRIKIETRSGPRWIAAVPNRDEWAGKVDDGFIGECYSYRWIKEPSGWTTYGQWPRTIYPTPGEALDAAKRMFTADPPCIPWCDNDALEERRFKLLAGLIIGVLGLSEAVVVLSKIAILLHW